MQNTGVYRRRIDYSQVRRLPAVLVPVVPVTGRIMSSLTNAGGLAGKGGIAGEGGGLAG